MSSKNASWSRVVRHTHATNDTDQRYTPAWVLELIEKIMGGIDLDPCADPRKRVPANNHFTEEMNGLELGWKGRVFLNPPFSNSSDWVKHLCIYFHAGAITEAVILLPVMSLSNKSASLLMKGTATAFTLLGRKLSFLDGNYDEIGEMSSFPYALVYCGDKTNHFLNVTENNGIGCLIRQVRANKKTSLCDHCRKSFLSSRSTAKYCSTTCRVEAFRKKKDQIKSGLRKK